jgi:peroxiredoxin
MSAWTVLIFDTCIDAKGGLSVMPKIGEPAPDFTLVSHAGKQVALTKLRGRKVILWFYPEADTPG